MPKLLAPDSAARFKVINHPEALPNKCAACSVGYGDAKRKFIDTTLDLDFYGVVYFCTNCFLEIANTLGFVSPEQNVGIILAFKDIQKSAQELVRENEDLRNTIRVLIDHRCYSPSVVHDFETINADPEGSGDLPEENSGDGIDLVSESADDVEPDVIPESADASGPAKPNGGKPGKRDILADLGL